MMSTAYCHSIEAANHTQHNRTFSFCLITKGITQPSNKHVALGHPSQPGRQSAVNHRLDGVAQNCIGLDLTEKTIQRVQCTQISQRVGACALHRHVMGDDAPGLELRSGFLIIVEIWSDGVDFEASIAQSFYQGSAKIYQGFSLSGRD